MLLLAAFKLLALGPAREKWGIKIVNAEHFP